MLEKIRNAIERLQHAIIIDDSIIDETIKDLQRALISADVSVELVFELSKRLKEKAKQKPEQGLTRKEFIIKCIYEMLVQLLGYSHELPATNRILLVGLFGQGKTTTAAKLARFYAKQGKDVLLVCADTARAASYDQLRQLAEKINVKFYGDPTEKNSFRIISKALELTKNELIIVDSAGRSALDKDLIAELKEINNVLKADQRWLILSADLGQTARIQAKAFGDAIKINGIILTKMDGSAKGGGALASCAETNSKVYFIGLGEKLDDLKRFDANTYLSRILGYGDLEELLERAKEAQISADDFSDKEFTLDTFYKYIESASKIGTFSKIAELIGLKHQIEEEKLQLGEEKLKKFKYIIQSMTFTERKNPEILNSSRIKRIANGSGCLESEVRELIKNYKHMKRMFDRFQKLQKEGIKDIDMKRLAKLFGKKKRIKLW